MERKTNILGGTGGIIYRNAKSSGTKIIRRSWPRDCNKKIYTSQSSVITAPNQFLSRDRREQISNINEKAIT